MIIVRIWEGLGNQLFQYAYARALKDKGYDVRLDMGKSYDQTFDKYKGHAVRWNSIQNFRISLPTLDVETYGKYDYIRRETSAQRALFYLASHHLWKYGFYEETTQAYSKRSANIRGNCYVKGWFQDERYFKGIRNTLLHELIPRDKIIVSKELKSIMDHENTVSVHIRRGDYIRIHHALPKVYYKRAIEQMKEALDRPYFIFFTDDPDWSKAQIKPDAPCIYICEERNYKDYEELMLMSRCKAHIISNSTFGWWGAWLDEQEGKQVIAPKMWFSGQKNIVPSEWMVI